MADKIKDSEQNSEEKKDKKDNNDGKLRYCFSCRRTEDQTGPLIEIPGGFSICRDCMQKTMDLMKDNDFTKIGFPPNVVFGSQYSSFTDFMNEISGVSEPEEIGKLKPKKKKKKEKTEEEAPPLTIKNVPPPHKIKAQLD